MNESVLTLGERIVLAARMAALEHIRRELAQATAESDAAAEDNQTFGKLPTIDSIVRGRWAAYFGHAEITAESAPALGAVKEAA